jgi:hypothetical protein
VYYNAETRGSRAKELLLQSYRIAEEPPAEKRPLVHRVIRGSGGK